jgi:hypothetical protein
MANGQDGGGANTMVISVRRYAFVPYNLIRTLIMIITQELTGQIDYAVSKGE